MVLKRKIKKLLYLSSPFKYRAFIDFPFNILQPMPAACRLERLYEVENFITSLPTPARISDGTLLGIVREQKIIEHDNDFDFDILYDVETINRINSYASEKNWKLGSIVTYSRKIQQLCFYDKDFFIYDFIIWHPGLRFYLNYHEPKHFRIMERKYLDDFNSITLNNGMKFRVPNDVKTYLVYRYGKTWSVPQTEKDNWQDDCGDLERIL